MSKKKESLNWHLKTGDELADAAFTRFDSIREDQSDREDEARTHLAMYGNVTDFGFGSDEFQYTRNNSGLTLNVVKIIIDTLSSKIGSNQPRPFFLTEEGNYSAQEQAKKLNKFVYGQFYQSKTYEKSIKAFLCACVFGDGELKHYTRDGKIHTDWVLPTEIFVDQREAIYGAPRSKFQVRKIDRETLKARYPEHKEAIDNIEVTLEDYVGDSALSDMVEIVEAWRLPSKKDAKDGKHAIFVKGKTLFEEEWKHEYFPFSHYQIFDPVLGYYAEGVAETLRGIQIEINRTIKRISEAIKRMAVPRVFLERGSRVNKNHLNNEVGGIVEYDGRPPVFDVARAIGPELANYLENLYAKAFEVMGLSQLTAQSKKPAGLDSGKAIREYNDIETERFARIAKGWENFHLDIARHYVALAKELSESEEHKDYSVLSYDKEGTERIKWSEIQLEEDSYIMQLYPTSMLPKTPSGRLQYTQELLEAGFIGQEEGLALLDFPDIESVTQFRTATYKMATKIINGFIKGKYVEPDTYHKNAEMLPYIQNALTYFETQNLEDSKLDLFREWIDEALLLINPPQEVSTEMEGETMAVAEDAMAEPEQVDQAMMEQAPPV